MRIQGLKAAVQLTNHLRLLSRKDNTQIKHFVTTPVRWIQNVTWEEAKPFKEIPSELMLPIIGTFWQMLPIIGRYEMERQTFAYHDKRKRFGDIIRERVGSYDIVLCFTVEDLKRVIKAEGIYPYRIDFTTIKTYRESRKKYYSTPGLLILQGKEWHDLRSKTQKHLLKPTAMQAYLEPLQDVARNFVKRIFEVRDTNKEVPELLKELCKFSLEAVCLVGLDTRLGCLQGNLSADSDAMKMIESAETAMDCINKMESFTGRIQFWRLFSTPTWRKFTKASDNTTKIAFKYVNKALDNLKHDERKENNNLTLLQAMLAKKDLTVSDAVVFVGDMMLAGIETTSLAVGFCLYHLARNPEKQDLLHQEVMRLLPTEDVKLNPSIFESLKYLRACLKESMRLSPMTSGSARKLTHDTVLSGYQVPAGTLIFVLNQGIYMDEKIFKNATQFLPDRWLNKDERPPPFSLIPFGIGPRSCIGKRLAEVELVALMTEIIRNFKVEYHFEDIGMYTKLIHVPDKPFRFNFIDR